MMFLLLLLLDAPAQKTCPGDANGDGVVGPMDIGYVNSYFGCSGNKDDPMSEECCMADLNEDERVDGLDIEIVLDHLGEVC